MIPTSDAFKRTVVGPHDWTARLVVEQDGVEVLSLPLHDGSVTIDRTQEIRGSFDAKVTDKFRNLVPQSITDLLSPLEGEICRLYRGVLIPHVERITSVDTTQSDFATGTRDGTVAADDGSLVLGIT